MTFNEVLDFFGKFQGMIEEQTNKRITALPEDPYNSAEIKELATALAAAQGEFPKIGHNRENPWFKKPYADLHLIITQTSPILSKHGLSITQQERLDDGMTVLHTRLWHNTGQWLETRNRIVTKNDENSYGSAVLFYKRMALMSLLGITMNDDPYDDDAERSMNDVRIVKSKGTAPTYNYNPKKSTNETVTKEQLEELEYELSKYPDQVDDILRDLRIEELQDMPKSEFHRCILRVRDLNNLRDGLKK